MGRRGEEGGGGGRTCCIVLVYWTTGVTPAGQASKYWLILTGDHTRLGHGFTTDWKTARQFSLALTTAGSQLNSPACNCGWPGYTLHYE